MTDETGEPGAETGEPTPPVQLERRTCKKCGSTFATEAGAQGRPRILCFACKTGGNKVRDLRRLSDRDPVRGASEAAAQGMTIGTDGEPVVAPPGPSDAARGLRFASAFAALGSAELAARMCGLSDSEIDDVQAEAQALYADVMEASPGAVQRLMASAQLLLASIVIAKSEAMSAASAAAALKAITSSLESLQQGGRATYSEIVVSVPGMSSESEDLGEVDSVD